MPGAAKFIGGCDCDCPRTLCAQVNCSDGSPISGASITLFDDDTPPQVIGSCTTDANGHCCFSNKYPVPANYGIRASATGYVAADGSTTITLTGAITCGADKTVVFTFCKAAAQTLIVNATVGRPEGRGRCGLPGATVSISGDITATGTTSDYGAVAFSLAKPAGKCAADLTITVTPPSGYGATTTAASYTLHFCGGSKEVTIWVPPSGGHSLVTWYSRYLPTTLNYSDSLGSCNISENGGGSFEGSYYFTSSHCSQSALCNTVRTCVGQKSGSVLAKIQWDPSGPCKTSTYHQSIVWWNGPTLKVPSSCSGGPALATWHADECTYLTTQQHGQIDAGDDGAIINHIISIPTVKVATDYTMSMPDQPGTATITGTI